MPTPDLRVSGVRATVLAGSCTGFLEVSLSKACICACMLTSYGLPRAEISHCRVRLHVDSESDGTCAMYTVTWHMPRPTAKSNIVLLGRPPLQSALDNAAMDCTAEL